MEKERKWDGVALAGSFILIVMFSTFAQRKAQ